jgi:hypothetical protein
MIERSPGKPRHRAASLHQIQGRRNDALTRAHCGIDNELHWVLDVSWVADACLNRDQNAARNMATLRKMMPTSPVSPNRTAQTGQPNALTSRMTSESRFTARAVPEFSDADASMKETKTPD